MKPFNPLLPITLGVWFSFVLQQSMGINLNKISWALGISTLILAIGIHLKQSR